MYFPSKRSCAQHIQPTQSMTSDSTQVSLSFSPSTRTAFIRYLSENPNNRRISQVERDNIVEWLTNPLQRPSTQKEFSRRNYVRRTFEWNEDEQVLLAVGKTSQHKSRVVVTEDRIVDLVDSVHQQNSHAGWDATWATLSSSYYGVLRSDLIYLLRRCQICADNPSKRPKCFLPPTVSTQAVEGQHVESVDTRDSRLNNLDQIPTDSDAEPKCGISEDIREESKSCDFGYDHRDWLEGDI